ncbi:hypothetical protein FB384_004867 [Prauserella sediminis]|uniref:Head-to-tail adaptor n=1 Tax=Prauserella sediminis TaxID=577680 RepID=A0A839XXW1_9PSEU|nr:hypothetical protein [Prauserella sediminis]MBB3665908.1 hypothetical protein [Prauserella sediminis]
MTTPQDAQWVSLADDSSSEGDLPRPLVDVDGTWALPASGGSGPCRTWPLDPSCGCLPDDPASWAPEHQRVVEAASEILWRLTAGRFGLCHDTVRPCRRNCLPDDCYAPPATSGLLLGSRWVNMGCAHQQRPCGCGPVSEIALPGPVHVDDEHPVAVRVDGAQLDPTVFRLVDGNRLIRVDGQKWPDCQDFTADLDEPGAFGIDYWRGNPVPPGGRRAVALLACELWKACNGLECQLPNRVEQVQREGVTMTMVNSQEFLERGRVGITEADMWLSSVNPSGLRQPPAVYSPDLPSVRW